MWNTSFIWYMLNITTQLIHWIILKINFLLWLSNIKELKNNSKEVEFRESGYATYIIKSLNKNKL